ncbi:MAG: MarR family winged helix-turn-helix transcriptional regulator [Clostridia bacterium]|nr:MarR family winged helix-turn-helix transcriptional regulator [Clostridia bacterium]
MEDLFVDFTISILKLNKLVQKIKTFEIEKYNLKPVHVMCGYYLFKNPQGLTAKDLGELTLEDKAAISRALKIMSEKGYVKYDANSRNSTVKLTEEGKEFACNICTRAEKAVEAGSVDFTDKERIFFYKSLDAIVDNLKNYYKELIKSND